MEYNREHMHERGIREQMIEEALVDPAKLEIQLDDHEGFPQTMVIGSTNLDVILEIGIKHQDTDDFAFHVNTARAHYRKKYLNRRR